MKQVKIVYWTTTILFAAYMILSGIPDILVVPEAKQFMQHLGYPVYLIPFLGVAKVLGGITILVPGQWKIKDLAYAGFCFDLVGATYSNIAVEGPKPIALFMILPLGLLALSYVYHKKYRGRRAGMATATLA